MSQRATKKLQVPSNSSVYKIFVESIKHTTPISAVVRRWVVLHNFLPWANTSTWQLYYQHLYRQAHAPAVCADCGAKPKYGTTFSRRSPNATLITVHLKESTGFEGEIKDDDTICMSCYKCHLSILQETSGSINRAALEHNKHMETPATKLRTHSPSLYSQQWCMSLQSLYKTGPSFFHKYVMYFSGNMVQWGTHRSCTWRWGQWSTVQF